MFPEGRHRSTLGEIARITSGGTPDRSDPTYWGGSVPWVTTGNSVQHHHGQRREDHRGWPQELIGKAVPARHLADGCGSGQDARAGRQVGHSRNDQSGLCGHPAQRTSRARLLLSLSRVAVRGHPRTGQCRHAAEPECKHLEGTAGGGATASRTATHRPHPCYRDQATSVATRRWRTCACNGRACWQPRCIFRLLTPMPAVPTKRWLPRSVQAGIPNLPATPEGWQRMPLG